MSSHALSPRTSMSRIRLLLLAQAACILLVMGYPQTSSGTIFVCPSGDTTVFQDRPCPMKKHVEKVRKPVNRYPLSIDESWFDLPEQAEERAFCDRRGCECGRIEKKHERSLVRAVADSLYLDGSWHRYDTSYEAWLETPSGSQDSHELREQLLEASCEVMMSQVLLLNYATDVLKLLRKRVHTAEERGFDIEEPCLQNIPEACAFYESVEQYSRMQNDAAALRRSRASSVEK